MPSSVEMEDLRGNESMNGEPQITGSKSLAERPSTDLNQADYHVVPGAVQYSKEVAQDCFTGVKRTG